MTMHFIQSIVTTGGESNVTFSSIPQTYTHLQLRVNWFSTGSGAGDFQLGCAISGDEYPGSGLYSWHNIQGSGAAVNTTQALTNWNFPIGNKAIFGANTTNVTAVPSVAIADFLDYTGTTKNKIMKSIAGNDNNGSGWAGFQGGQRMNTGAVTSIKLWSTATSHLFGAGSRFDLYGVTSNPIATGA